VWGDTGFRKQVPGQTRTFRYDTTGTTTRVTDQGGHTVSIGNTAATNYAAPSTITPNSEPNLATTYAWNGALEPTATQGPNLATTTAAYDASGRAQSSTNALGGVTTYQYTVNPITTKATTNGRWVKTTVDGFGRTVKVETGDGSGTKTVVETEYDSCACSPLGKLKRVSQPYAPGGPVYWTTYSYDALGRTLTVTLPNNSGTTSYAYQGNQVTVTDAAGKWKKYTTNAMGELVQVTEPNPGGGANLETYYTYTITGKLGQASMTRGSVTQVRTWNYDPATQRLTSVTHPESGTTTFWYNAEGLVWRKFTGIGYTEYAYDAYHRVTGWVDTANIPCGAVTIYYDNTMREWWQQNTWGRVTQQIVGDDGCGGQYAYKFQHKYSYNAAGQVVGKSQWVIPPGKTWEYGIEMSDSYEYDTEGRMTKMWYPEMGTPVTYGYDTMGRLAAMTGPAPYKVDSVAYNAAGQMTQMKV